MTRLVLQWPVGLVLAALVGSSTIQAAPVSSPVIANIDLTKPFAARSSWRFIATQGPRVPHPFEANETAPGVVQVCVKKVPNGRCVPDIIAMQPWPKDADWEPHFLEIAKFVYPHGRGAPPLLFLRTRDLGSFNGDQTIFTEIVAYRRGSDRFVPIYKFATQHNQNQEVRFVTAGRLAGSIISAEPTSDAPFGYWITVNELTRAYSYRQTLRYRSATRYGDANPLAVIDSEMPNIHRRLGLWRRAMPLPLPARGCARPHLIKTELWCS